MRMHPEASLQTAPPNCRPPDLPPSTNKNRYQSERTSASRYIIPAWRFRGNTGSRKTAGKTRKLQILAKIDDGNRVHRARFHLKNSNLGSKFSFIVSKENERNIRKPSNCNLRGTNQYIKKLQENNEKFERRNKIIKKYEELLVVRLMDNPMERRNFPETTIGPAKRECLEIPRGGNLLQNHSPKDSENLAKIPPQSDKRRTPQEMFSTSNKALTRLGCGFKADQMALNFVLEFSTPFLWPQDRPHDEMSEEEETRESYDIKNGNGSEGSKKFKADYGIPLPWP